MQFDMQGLHFAFVYSLSLPMEGLRYARPICVVVN